MSSALSPGAPGVALVTGSTGGIGKEVAHVLAKCGYSIVLHHFLQFDAASKLQSDLGPDRAFVVQADLRLRAEVKAMIDSVEEHYGRLDVVVNNAGVMEQAAFEELTEEIWENVLNVNLSGPYRVLSEALRLLQRSDHPSVVNVSSQGAYSGLAGAVAYSASKAGVLGLTRALAREIGPHIRVNAIAPGPIETPMTSAHATAEWIHEKTSKLVMGRFGTPAEVASVVRFLVSDEASFMTGQTLSVNGGGVMT
jgi:3-oxoacyl-[acyl-carrier protein] reductase